MSKGKSGNKTLSENVLAVLLMVKNEKDSIATTINSTKNYIKHIILYDTGSTDNTIEIAKTVCKKNGQVLHIKEGVFTTFPESRNCALEFANTFPFKFLLLMDAGDELQMENKEKGEKEPNKNTFLRIINKIPVNYGVVKQKWIDNGQMSDHVDIRLVKNIKTCRYDLDTPVHEVFKFNTENKYDKTCDLTNILYLYQDRDKYGGSTKSRYTRDIELLRNAKPTKRNLYFLAQSYMSIDDYANGFKYNVQSLETPDETGLFTDEKFTYVRAAFCAMKCNMTEEVVFKYLNKSVDCDEPPVDSYVYILKYAIENNKPELAKEHVQKLFNLEKPEKTMLVNYHFYDYIRYHLIGVVCLQGNYMIELGHKALKKIEKYQRPNDLHNLALYENIMNDPNYEIVRTVTKDSDKEKQKEEQKEGKDTKLETKVEPKIIELDSESESDSESENKTANPSSDFVLFSDEEDIDEMQNVENTPKIEEINEEAEKVVTEPNLEQKYEFKPQITESLKNMVDKLSIE